MEKNFFLFDNETEHSNIVVQSWQDHFCRLAGVYAFCLDSKGTPLTKMSASVEEADLLMQNVLAPHNLERIFKRVTESVIEDQAVEDTDYPNVRLAASAIKDKSGKVYVVWIVCAVIINRDTGKKTYPEPLLDGLSRGTTESRLFDTLDLLNESMRGLVKSKVSRDEAIEASEISRRMEQEMEIQVKRAEVMTEVVSLLDSDEGFDANIRKAAELVGTYMNLSNIFVAKIPKDGSRINITMQWKAEGEEHIFLRTRDLERYWFLRGDSISVISSNTRLTPGDRDQLDELGLTALVVIPIKLQLNEDTFGEAMFFCLGETREERIFDVEDVKLLSDTGRVLQTIAIKRNQQNSLESTKKVLIHMLDNIGSSIYVRDLKTNAIRYTNQSLESHFKAEIKQGTLMSVFEDSVPTSSSKGNYEIYYPDKEKWYDLYFTHMQWVDDRPASLCAIYDVTEKKVYQKRIEQQAYTDFLTGLYNRLCFERDLAQDIDDAVHTNSKGILMYIDLDDFKHINDGLGHQYGDILLKYISQAMNSIQGLSGSCYRMGGDEFVAVITKDQYDRAEEIQEEIKAIFSKPWYLKDADYYCTMSMGTVEFPTEGSNVNELVQKADIAMYAAKKSGKNRVVHYSADIDSTSERRLDMEKNMRDASLDDYQEFEIYYQPIVNNGSNGARCHGAEALVRWNSKSGFISPGEFIPLAEYLGLIAPIGNHVLEEACKACKQWNDDSDADFTVNVNLSVVQLLLPDIVEVIRKALEDSGLNPQHLTLEVTESLAINDLDRTKAILMNIKHLGVNLALDDFGTGYSSLNNIRALPYDIIKVDQNFVKDLADDAYSQSFIRMIAELAEAIEADVCVEGIETLAQYQVLEDMKVKYIQGFYFSKPIPRDQFEKKYIYKDDARQRRGLLNVDL